MDPVTMAALIQGGSAVLGKVLDSPGAGPSRADSSLFATNSHSFDFNNSGWAIDFGEGSASATGSVSAPAMSWYVIAGLGLAALLVWKKLK